MIRLFGKIASTTAQHAAVVTVVAGGVASFVIIGAVVVPSRGVALTATYPDSSTLNTPELTDDQTKLVDALKRIIERSYAIIRVSENESESAQMVLWTTDRRDIGSVNEDEVLIVTYAPLLHAALGLSHPPVDAVAPAMTTAALFSDTLSVDWRRSPGVQQSILATDVTAMRMESVRRSDAGLTVRVGLTFSGRESDDDPEHRAEAMFVVTLPAVARSR